MPAVLKCIFYLVVIQTCACYSDALGNSSLKVLPAKLGTDIELRCTKVVERSEGDVIMSAVCSDESLVGCGHVWSKNGTVLNATTTNANKFEFSSETTVGYCATFGDTTDAFNKFGFSNDSYGFKCMATSMKIKRITIDDLGVYTCNFSYHYTNERSWQDPSIDETEVVQIGTKHQLKEVTYFTSSYQNSAKQMLLQCVVTGGKLNWFVKLTQSEYVYKYNNGCGYSECPDQYIPIEKLSTSDHWMCYNFSIETFNPFPNVTESLIGFKNLCRIDMDTITCTVDDQARFEYNWEKRVTITQRMYYEGYSPYYYSNDIALILSIICIPILLGLSLIAFSVIAFIRGKVCDCCSGRNHYSTVAIVPQQGQVQQQVFIQPHTLQHNIQPHLQPQIQPHLQPQQIILQHQQVLVQQPLPLQVLVQPEPQRVPIPGPARIQGHTQPDIETFENDELGQSLI